MDIGYWIYVLGAGLALGAFTSRFLTENFYHALPGLSSLPQTTLVSPAITLALIALWRLYSAACARRGETPLHQTLANDALTYTPLFLLRLTVGIAHPTGYPLYILLGKLFTLLPISNVARRVNLISPLFASLAVVCLYLCLAHLTRHRAISLLVILIFAFSHTFWPDESR